MIDWTLKYPETFAVQMKRTEEITHMEVGALYEVQALARSDGTMLLRPYRLPPAPPSLKRRLKRRVLAWLKEDG